MRTTLIPPFRTARTHRDQAIAALGEANRVRLRRASLMRWLYGQSSARSHERAAELILEPDQAVCSMLVLDLLARIPQVGPAQAERMLATADVPPTRTAGALTARQRAALAAGLRLRADQLAHRDRAKAPRSTALPARVPYALTPGAAPALRGKPFPPGSGPRRGEADGENKPYPDRSHRRGPGEGKGHRRAGHPKSATGSCTSTRSARAPGGATRTRARSSRTGERQDGEAAGNRTSPSTRFRSTGRRR